MTTDITENIIPILAELLKANTEDTVKTKDNVALNKDETKENISGYEIKPKEIHDICQRLDTMESEISSLKKDNKRMKDILNKDLRNLINTVDKNKSNIEDIFECITDIINKFYKEDKNEDLKYFIIY